MQFKDPFKRTTNFCQDNFTIHDTNTSPQPAIPKYAQSRWYDPTAENKRKEHPIPYWIGYVGVWIVGFAVILLFSGFTAYLVIVQLGKYAVQVLK